MKPNFVSPVVNFKQFFSSNIVVLRTNRDINLEKKKGKKNSLPIVLFSMTNLFLAVAPNPSSVNVPIRIHDLHEWLKVQGLVALCLAINNYQHRIYHGVNYP